jgi:hypothetical protein
MKYEHKVGEIFVSRRLTTLNNPESHLSTVIHLVLVKFKATQIAFLQKIQYVSESLHPFSP